MPSPRPWKMIRYVHKWTALSGPLSVMSPDRRVGDLDDPATEDLALSRSIWAHQFGEPALSFAETLTDLYRGTSLIRNTPPAGPCSSPMPRDLW